MDKSLNPKTKRAAFLPDRHALCKFHKWFWSSPVRHLILSHLMYRSAEEMRLMVNKMALEPVILPILGPISDKFK